MKNEMKQKGVLKAVQPPREAPREKALNPLQRRIRLPITTATTLLVTPALLRQPNLPLPRPAAGTTTPQRGVPVLLLRRQCNPISCRCRLAPPRRGLLRRSKSMPLHQCPSVLRQEEARRAALAPAEGDQKRRKEAMKRNERPRERKVVMVRSLRPRRAHLFPLRPQKSSSLHHHRPAVAQKQWG